jgi:nucleoid-associated protein YgaU
MREFRLQQENAQREARLLKERLEREAQLQREKELREAQLQREKELREAQLQREKAQREDQLRREAEDRIKNMKRADEMIVEAKNRLDWAASVGAEQTYRQQYNDAKVAYGEAVNARGAESWDTAFSFAQKVLVLLKDVKDTAPLPARYTVRPWAETKDCFWNIAGYPFVYGDPTKWTLLYEANKTKLRRPDNPNLIHPGLVLDIPSLRGESREGLWVKGRAYAPLPAKK